MGNFQLASTFKLSGDQPQAVRDLVRGVQEGERHQVLLGVTGSGKTFTMANLIASLNLPTLVISHNKTLAAQLYAEFKRFFPENAVEYFISYYDYYQPEAYIPSSDTYIEKDSSINDAIDRLRLKATTALLERKDVIVVASVSCIYNIGNPSDYKNLCATIEKGRTQSMEALLQSLVSIYYQRNEVDFSRGKFRVKGDTVEIFPSYLETALRVEFNADEVERISQIDPLTGHRLGEREKACIYPAKHFVTTRPRMEEAVKAIKKELAERLEELRAQGKLLEAQRLEQRTRFDMEMLLECGFCHGVENYSRPLSGRAPGERPFCLMDYFPKDFLVILDESHVSLPQLVGMYEGDHSRKLTLVEYGFRLPSALDNRPLKFAEFESLVPRAVYVSATPGPYELKKSKGVIVEQVIRPTGLVDPEVSVRPVKGQIEDLISEIQKTLRQKGRALVTVLTKRMAEDLCDFLMEKGMRVRYLHSDIDTLARIEILKDLRKGAFDVLVGVNLLREGLDLPEVSLVAVLDADKEGFLRSETTLIQISGRAARNIQGHVILYADNLTGSIQRALSEMSRRRKKQEEHNQTHRITPRSIEKAVEELEEFTVKSRQESLSLIREGALRRASRENLPQLMKDLERQMKEAVDILDFELAAVLRDELFELKGIAPEKRRAGQFSAERKR